MKIRVVGLLAAGHLAVDINQGALPAMLPFFISAYDLSYAAAAGIVFAANMTSSIVQPLFGLAADRHARPWLLPLGLMLAGTGLALTGMSPDYAWVMGFGVVSGVGIAAYHPEAARLVNFAAGKRKGTAMSVFGVGGTMGFAVGPLVITTAMLHWGLNGTLVLLVPVTIMALVMANHASRFRTLEQQHDRAQRRLGDGGAREHWGAFGGLILTVIGRSIIFYGLNTFIPLYWIHGLDQSRASGAMALTLFAGSGIAGNLLGGAMADRLGQKKVMLLGFAALTFLLPLLIWVHQVWMATVLLIPVGMSIYATYSPSVVLGQSYLPNRVGLSSGITLGVAVAIGGGAAPVIGRVADLHGIWWAMASVAFLPLLILVIAVCLPDARFLEQAKTTTSGLRSRAP